MLCVAAAINWPFDTGLHCDVTHVNQTSINCTTPLLNTTLFPDVIGQPQKLHVSLTLAGSARNDLPHGDVTFTYKPNPVLNDVEPLTSIIK